MEKSAEQKLQNLIPTKSQIKKVSIDSYNINYLEAGAGQPIILIHGLNIGWGEWHQNIAELAKYFKIYALDLPGSGNSTKIDFHNADLEKKFVKIVDKFIIIKKIADAVIIGHSIGGWIALKLATQNKKYLKSVIAVNSLGFSDYMPWRFRILAFYPIALLLSKTVMKPSPKNIKNFVASVMNESSSLKKEFIDYFCESINKEFITHPFLLINNLFASFAKIKKGFILKDSLNRIKCPVFLIASDKDPLIPLKKTEPAFNLIPNFKKIIIPNTGHVPLLEQSEYFNAIVINFIKKHNA